MMARIATLLGLSMLLIGCTGEDLIKNPEVDVWCGDTPCGWDADGEIARVGTWHSHDYAVSFEGEDTRLHQLNDDVDDNVGCMSFSMIAKVAPGTDAYVALDFQNDGMIDWEKPIPAADFDAFTFYVTPPSWFTSVRFIVGKRGGGELVLAKLRALDTVSDYAKCTAPEVRLEDRPAYAECDRDEQCRSGLCLDSTCAGCTSDEDCESGVCGYAVRFDTFWGAQLDLDVVPMCVDEGSRLMGALCLGDGECETGLCCEGVCSECCGEGSCGEDIECALSVARTQGDDYVLPHQCAPGMGLRESGALCTDDSDCAGGRCGDRLCSGLCSEYWESLGSPDCAKSDCDSAHCADGVCEVQTIEVGACD